VQYAPQQIDDWKVSTPEAQGFAPKLVRELFWEAAQLEDINSLLLVKNGHLIAEAYFHDGSIDATCVTAVGNDEGHSPRALELLLPCSGSRPPSPSAAQLHPA
jgi:hypothetical protein